MSTRVWVRIDGKYEKIKLSSILDSLETRLKGVKRESLREFFERVRLTAIENIERHSEETGVPLTGKLESSIRYEIPRPSRGRMYVGGPDVPYAAIHEHGNQGGLTLLVPTNGKYLVFLNHRTGQINRRRFVMMPSYEYLSSAWDAHTPEFAEIMEDNLRNKM